jgi:hypothetical protein
MAHSETVSGRTQKALAAQQQREKQNKCNHEFVIVSQTPSARGTAGMVSQKYRCTKCPESTIAQKWVGLDS